MTFNGVMAVILRSANLVAFGTRCVKVAEDIPKLYATEKEPKASSFQRYITPSGVFNARRVAKYSDFGRIDLENGA